MVVFLVYVVQEVGSTVLVSVTESGRVVDKYTVSTVNTDWIIQETSSLNSTIAQTSKTLRKVRVQN